MSSEAWWQRPVWPTTRVVTWAERRAWARALGARVGRALGRPAVLAAAGVIGLVALVAAVWFAGASQAHPEWLWVGGAMVVAAAVAGLLHRTRGARRGFLGSRPAGPVAGVLALTLLVGVPWALAGPSATGPTRALGAVLPVASLEAAQVGEHVALADVDGGLTMLDLATGTARPVDLEASATMLSATADGRVVVTTDDGQALVTEEGAVVWERHGWGTDARTVVAADAGLVVLAQSARHTGAAQPAVALRPDGSQAWSLDATSGLVSMFAPGGVVGRGAEQPTVAVLEIDGTPTAVDVATGRALHAEPGTAAAAVIGDLVLWQQTAGGVPFHTGLADTADGPCTVVATRGDTTLWRTTAPCLGYVEGAHGDTAIYLAQAEDGTSEYALDLATGATRDLAGAWPLGAMPGTVVAFETSGPSELTGRTVGREPTSGAVRWSSPGAGRVSDVPWAASDAGAPGTSALVTTSRPAGFNPLAPWRTPNEVSLLDPATGVTVASVRCGGPAMSFGVALDDGRGLALCPRADGTFAATVLGPEG